LTNKQFSPNLFFIQEVLLVYYLTYTKEKFVHNQTGKPLWEQAINDSMQAVEKRNEKKQQATLSEQDRFKINRTKAEAVTRELEAFFESAEWDTAQLLLRTARLRDDSFERIQIIRAHFATHDYSKLPIKENIYLDSDGLSQSPKETVEKILAVDEASRHMSINRYTPCTCEMIVRGDNLEELVQAIRAQLDRIARWISIL